MTSVILEQEAAVKRLAQAYNILYGTGKNWTGKMMAPAGIKFDDMHTYEGDAGSLWNRLNRGNKVSTMSPVR